ncbi:MAG TPA: hypothetical protein GXX73_10005 [Clostridium sp.]|nr:hypothetical protein A7W90_05050 [Clostridium sp. Bc-iso-3]HHV29908.1 hypothetical protein [Clostridium sp.]
MRKIFVNSPEFIEPLRLSFESTIAYKKIEKNEIQTRLITQEEFDGLEPSQKEASKNLSYVGLAICLMACIIVFAAIFSLNPGELTKETVVCLGLILLGFILGGFGVILNAKDAVMKPDSQIAEGTAILLDKVYQRGKSGTHTFVMVAFNDQQAYVRSIKCNLYDYNMMSVGSKVYVKVKGSSATAYVAK